jgi:hypothetical protein
MSKVLYISAVGGDHAGRLLEDILPTFGDSTDFMLIAYDDIVFVPGKNAQLTREPGYKWPLAIKYLHPDKVADYDYLAIWDDDIGIGTFSLDPFIDLMRFNGLLMAQPALRSPYWISHPIVGQQRGRVGRFTNFVEVMVPVFSREGWRRFYPFLTEENTSGWGYDYVPIEPRGIVDSMYVIHTRPVSSCTEQSRSQLHAFHAAHGLTVYPTHDLGELKDPRCIQRG